MNDHHIQALADGEATDEIRAHAASCADCAGRVRARVALMRQMRDALAPPVAVPASLTARVDARLAADASQRPAGATRLRRQASAGIRLPHARRGWVYGASAAAATLIAVLFVAPVLRKTDSTLSASAILARSASQLSASVTGGIELLEYELVLDGVPKEMMPDSSDGTYRIRQAIDHNVRGRFRFASYAPDGGMVTSIAQDPQTRRRVTSLLVDGQPYRFEVSLPAKDAGLSLPEMERLHMEASIGMMQASGTQVVETIDGPHGKLYRIEVPRVAGPGTSPVWDLTEARVLIDARDYRITELSVSGSFLKQPYSLSYRLISHSVVASVPAEAFAVPKRAGEIVIGGEGSPIPSHDVVMLSLRELTRLKQGR
ncbi:MAG TPA: hypothetical protein VFK57_20375 [Vicinamibacterales bacterium]|nr:hypothetical protein [Vicinamibacterales bacterium]